MKKRTITHGVTTQIDLESKLFNALESISKINEEKKETKTGVVHKSEPGGYGRKVDINKPEDKKAQPAVKRGRGRPKKDADSDTGEVKKWDTDTLQRWIVGSKPKTLPGKASVKHKMKDESVAEGSEYTPPKLGTVKASIMNTTTPTVQIQVFKHNTLRGDSYWVTKQVKTFKTMDQAKAYVDRINKQGVAEDAEQIDELKKSTLKSYIQKADAEVSDIKKKQAEHPRGHISAVDADKKMNRQIGINQATKRIVRKDLTGVEEDSVDSKYPHGEVKYRIVYRRSGEKVEGEKSFASKADAQKYVANNPEYSVQAYRVKQGVAEGYILKKTRVEKTFTPGDPDEYYTSGGADVTTKDTDYEIINNKTGQVVGTASWTTNDYFGPGALKITMKNGATRWIDIWEREKGNPQSAFNRFVKDPRTAKKYKEQGVAEGKVMHGDGKELYVGIEAYGVKGMKSTPWRKRFKSQEAFEKWLDSTEGDVEVHGTREVDLNNSSIKEEKKETKTGVVHKSEPGGYGRKVDINKPEDKKAQPAVKRGRGRPKKDADSDTGEVKKWDNAKSLQSWVVGNLPSGKAPGKKGQVHKLKDWMEHVNRSIIAESYIADGKSDEIEATLKDIALSDDGYKKLEDGLNGLFGKEVQMILQDMENDVANEHSLHLDDDFEEIKNRLIDTLQTQYGSDLDEANVTMSPVQSGAQQIKVDDKTIGVTTNSQTANNLKQSLEKGDLTLNIDDTLKESTSMEYSQKLSEILADYPYEHKNTQEGWGMPDNFYHALCDHYWRAGRIPREVMYGSSDQLRSYVEECYTEDTSIEEGMAGAALGATAGALLTKTPSGAMMGANIGSNLQDKIFNDDVEENISDEMSRKIKTPAVFRKSESPLSLSDVGTEPKFKVGNKYYNIGDETVARGNAELSGTELEQLPESELEASLRNAVNNMESSMSNYRKNKDTQMENWDKKLSALLSEGLTVTTSVGQQGLGDSVSVSATDEHAQTLMKILNDAGLTNAVNTNTEQVADTVQPVSSDEVMSQLSSEETDDTGTDALEFLKQMISNRHASTTNDGEIEHYSDEEETVKEDDVEEGNKFTGNLAKARAAGKKEADLDGDGDMEPVKENEGKKKNNELEQGASESKQCNECGQMYEGKGEDHVCKSEDHLNEWANTPENNVDDKGFIADINFITRSISGGLNNIKQDQTVLPNTKAKVDSENISMAELIRKIENIK